MTYRTLFDWFAASTDAYPDHVALEVSDQVLTYRELMVAVERMSAIMTQQYGGGMPARVGLLTSRSLVGCIGYLAAQRIGATVVPLNPASPAPRNIGISRDADLSLTVVDDTAGDGQTEYRAQAGVPLVDLTGDQWPVRAESVAADVPPVVARTPEDYAYITFTSGTTGHPKGVPTTHANVSSFLEAVIPRYEFGPGARVSQTFEMAFDGAILAMFGAWASGATLCVAERRDVLTPVRFVNAKRLTHWLSVPSLISFATRLRSLPADSMPTLRVSSFGGEALNVEQARAWLAAAPNTTIINCYGPTETTVIVTAYRLPSDPAAWVTTANQSVPIGDIYPHLDHVLLDQRLQPCGDGELCVRGAQRFPGYLDPAENTGRFLSFDGHTARVYDGCDPLTGDHWYRTGDRVAREHGELVHVGRIDDQIKVRGHRVELAEIEGTLRRHTEILDAVVVTVVAADGETDLHALYTGGPVAEAELVRLAEQLPVYMRPRYFHHRTALPLTAVDKVDRRRLADELSRATAPLP
jgi:amino acid adenylation domain-containing protein